MQRKVGTKDVIKEDDDELAETVYFCPSALTNLYGFSNNVKKYNHVYINTRNENCFIVTRKKGLNVKFPCSERGLYVRESTSQIDWCVYNYAGTHVKGFTPREVERDTRVRKFYHGLNAPTIVSLNVWIHKNMAENILMSFADADLAENLLKADVPTLEDIQICVFFMNLYACYVLSGRDN